MRIIQHSFLKYLTLAGLVLVLVSSSIALPTRPKAGAKTRALVAQRPAVRQTAKTHPTKPVSCPLNQSKAGSRLNKRDSPVIHPSGKNTITLFHGTSPDNARSIEDNGILLAKTKKSGDFHSLELGSNAGGMYFTDSLAAAAQFACYGVPRGKRPERVDVLEYSWTPGSFHIHELDTAGYENLMHVNAFIPGANKNEAKKIMKDSDMITGPMNVVGTDDLLTKDFWQYAIIKQEAVSGLHRVTTHRNIICARVPQRTGLTSDIYRKGQKSPRKNDAEFSALLKVFQTEKRKVIRKPTCVIA